MVHLLKFYEVFKLVEAIIKPSPYKVCPDYNFFSGYIFLLLYIEFKFVQAMKKKAVNL